MSETDGISNRSLILSGYGGLAFRTAQAAMFLHQNGIVSVGLGIGWRDAQTVRTLSLKDHNWVTGNQGYQMYVKQGIVTERLKIATVTNWPDYVFRKDYKLLPLSSVEAHIAANGHLPNIPSAATIEKEGMELGDMVKRQQEKIEELFLHLIEMQKRLEALETENAALKAAHLEPKK